MIDANLASSSGGRLWRITRIDSLITGASLYSSQPNVLLSWGMRPPVSR